MDSYQETAQKGLKLIKQAILQLLAANPEGLRNFQIADHLGIRSDHQGKQKDYLSYSVLGLLMRERAVTKTRGTYRRSPTGDKSR